MGATATAACHQGISHGADFVLWIVLGVVTAAAIRVSNLSPAVLFAHATAATPVWLHGGEDALARLVTVSASLGCHIGAASISTFSLFAEVAFGSKAEIGMCLPSRIATLQD